MRTIARYWVSAVLFTAYWLVTIRWSVDQLAAASVKTSAFSNGLEILVPVLAGGLIAFRGGAITAGMACGAALGILDSRRRFRPHSWPPDLPGKWSRSAPGWLKTFRVPSTRTKVPAP